jgi:hypothetical protein
VEQLLPAVAVVEHVVIAAGIDPAMRSLQPAREAMERSLS